jgi:6-phosphogluconolactonase
MLPHEIFPDAAALSERAAEVIINAARDAIAARGRFTLALTGGSGPQKTYEHLAAHPATIDWANVFVFLGDERFVSFDDERSNYGMCSKLLLSHVPVPKDQVFPIPTDTVTPEDAASEYAETLAQVLRAPLVGPPPSLDLILLGMGDDGHCASLFPGMSSLGVNDASTVSSPPGTLPPPVDRVTLTFPALNAARQVLFLVAGLKKASAVRDIFEGGASIMQHPSVGVQPAAGTLLWLLDSAAAGLLTEK